MAPRIAARRYLVTMILFYQICGTRGGCYLPDGRQAEVPTMSGTPMPGQSDQAANGTSISRARVLGSGICSPSSAIPSR
jgi:hypothetical protein